jgi:hypothetical protein
MPIRYPSDLFEDSWTQFVARLLSADTAGGEPLRALLSMLPVENLPTMASDWEVCTDHDSETCIGVGQLDILIKSPALRIIIENKVSSPLSPSQLQKYADHYDARQLRDSVPNLYLYLSPVGRKAIDPWDRWIPISYSEHISGILEHNLPVLEAQWGQIPDSFWDTFGELRARRVRGGTRETFLPGHDEDEKRAEWLDGVDSELRETVDLFLEMLRQNYRVPDGGFVGSAIAIRGKYLKDGTVKEVRLLKEARAFLAMALREVQRLEEIDMPPALGIYFHTPLPIDDTPFRDYAHRYPTATGFIITRNSLGFLDDFLDFCGVPPLRWSAEA